MHIFTTRLKLYERVNSTHSYTSSDVIHDVQRWCPRSACCRRHKADKTALFASGCARLFFCKWLAWSRNHLCGDIFISLFLLRFQVLSNKISEISRICISRQTNKMFDPLLGFQPVIQSWNNLGWFETWFNRIRGDSKELCRIWTTLIKLIAALIMNFTCGP